MRDFYERFYAALPRSRAHAEFCRRAFGCDFSQHGFADMAQINTLIAITRLGPGDRALDLGCGNGMIAEYISDRTGAHVTGLDIIPEAIRQAQTRTLAKADRLAFVVGDINALDRIPDAAFDAIISVDTMYFSDDYTATVGHLRRVLRAPGPARRPEQPGGQMAIFFSYGWEPRMPLEAFPIETLPPDKTPLAEALRANGLSFETTDFTQEDYQLALLRRQALTELKPQFEAEDILFIYENRMGEANGISEGVEKGLHRRYLYHVLRRAP